MRRNFSKKQFVGFASKRQFVIEMSSSDNSGVTIENRRRAPALKLSYNVKDKIIIVVKRAVRLAW